MSRLMITAMKNEAPSILEWVAYHRLIGFDDFLVFSNDCDDGTDQLLDVLEARGWLTHVRNDDYSKKGVQWTALDLAGKHPLTKAAEWVLFADVDEFVNIKVGEGRLDDLFAAAPEADAFALTWRLFGNSGRVNIDDGLVLEQFTQAAPFPCYAPWTASQFKTLFRNDGSYRKLGVHRPKGPTPQRRGHIRWVNGSGHRLPISFEGQSTITYGDLAGMDLVCLNHYSVKSAMAYLSKTSRGLPNRSQKEIDIGYWADRNFNEVEEVSIQRHLPKLRELLDEFQRDEELKNLKEQGLNWHRRNAAEILDTLEGLQLLTRIVGTQRRDIDPRLAHTLLTKRVELQRHIQAEKQAAKKAKR